MQEAPAMYAARGRSQGGMVAHPSGTRAPWNHPPAPLREIERQRQPRAAARRDPQRAPAVRDLSTFLPLVTVAAPTFDHEAAAGEDLAHGRGKLVDRRAR